MNKFIFGVLVAGAVAAEDTLQLRLLRVRRAVQDMTMTIMMITMFMIMMRTSTLR